MKLVFSNRSGIVIFMEDTKDFTDADQKAFQDRSGDKKQFLLRMKYNDELNHAWSRLKLFSDKKFFIIREVFNNLFMLPVRFLQVYGCPQEWSRMLDEDGGYQEFQELYRHEREQQHRLMLTNIYKGNPW